MVADDSPCGQLAFRDMPAAWPTANPADRCRKSARDLTVAQMGYIFRTSRLIGGAHHAQDSDRSSPGRASPQG